MDGQYYNLWSTDNDKTEANDEVVIKSVYDPSPVGYSLPASNAFSGFTTTGQNIGSPTTPPTPEQRAQFNVKGNWDKGWYFYTKLNKQGESLFFPAFGYRYDNTGSLDLVSTYGSNWVANVFNNTRGRYLSFSHYFIHSLNISSSRNEGKAVRSAEEK